MAGRLLESSEGIIITDYILVFLLTHVPNEIVVHLCVVRADILGFGGRNHSLHRFPEHNMHSKYAFVSWTVISLHLENQSHCNLPRKSAVRGSAVLQATSMEVNDPGGSPPGSGPRWCSLSMGRAESTGFIQVQEVVTNRFNKGSEMI